jgi:hypothetical protein
VKRRTFLLGAISVSALTWLALSDSPSARRGRKINDAIQSGRLGQLAEVPKKRLALQFPWLSRLSGASSGIRINQSIDPAGLNLVITTPEFENITGCGLWNALYDSTLQTIFVDQSLVWPTELLVEGDHGTITMFNLDDMNIVVGFLNFILAHELGHWKRHSPTAGCFLRAMPEDTSQAGANEANFIEEQAADALAVAAIMKGFEQNSVPQPLLALNSAQLFGASGANAAELGAMDIIVSTLEMTRKMLFSAGPYSPYFSDSRHPNFLKRCEAAIRAVTTSANQSSLIDRMPLVREELHRIDGLRSHEARELVLPEPISCLDVRKGQIWVGTVPVQPTPSSKDEKIFYPTEHVFSIPISRPDDKRQRASITLAESRLAGSSKPGANDDPYVTPGGWLRRLFNEGHAGLGLPAPKIVGPRPDLGHDDYSAFPGFLYTGTRWTWQDDAARFHEVDGDDLSASLAALGHSEVIIGPFRRMGSDIVVPFVSRRGTFDPTFRVVRLPSNGLEGLAFDPRFIVPLGKRPVDLGAAIYSQNSWWMPGVVDSVDGRKVIEICRFRPEAEPLSFARIDALINLIPPGAPKNMQARYTPREPRGLILSNDLLLMGYVGDSLFLINPVQASCKVLFHPIERGLRISDLGNGMILLWKENGRKCYIV